MALDKLAKRASIKPLTPASLALTIIGSLFVVSCAAIGFIYWRKRRQTPSTQAPKPDDRSSSAGSEEHQLESIVGNPRDGQPENNHRYSVGIMSRVSQGPRSSRATHSTAPNNRYSVGMLSRFSVDPSVTSPDPDRNRSRSRTREEKDRAYARMSMGVMSRVSMGARSPGPRSPRSPRDPLMSAGIMSRMSMAPPSPMPAQLSAAPSPAVGDGDFLEPPPRYS